MCLEFHKRNEFAWFHFSSNSEPIRVHLIFYNERSIIHIIHYYLLNIQVCVSVCCVLIHFSEYLNEDDKKTKNKRNEMRFMNKSGVMPFVKAPSMTDNNICITFDSVHLNQATDDGIVVRTCSNCDDETQPAGIVNYSTTNANNTKASKMLSMKTDGAAIIPKAIQVQPKFVRKTPKFPSRERHMAIRRKKPSTTKTVDAECRCVRHKNGIDGKVDDMTL